MKFLWNDKDGGPESRVHVWGLEIKSLFSVLLLKFDEGSREAFHTHAFNSVSWLLKGWLREFMIDGKIEGYFPSFRPIFTYRDTFHKVEGNGPASWVLTFRGPWVDTWREYLPGKHSRIVLTHGRKEVA